MTARLYPRAGRGRKYYERLASPRAKSMFIITGNINIYNVHFTSSMSLIQYVCLIHQILWVLQGLQCLGQLPISPFGLFFTCVFPNFPTIYIHNSVWNIHKTILYDVPCPNSPSGKKFRSKPQLTRYLGDSVDLSSFDFRTGKVNPMLARKNKKPRGTLFDYR